MKNSSLFILVFSLIFLIRCSAIKDLISGGEVPDVSSYDTDSAKDQVLSDLKRYKDGDYIAWIGHATFIIKLGDTTIITDPVFSKNAGPFIFGPKRFTDPALRLNEIPKIDLFLLTHNHYDHQDMMTIKRFPFKNTKVLTPLKLGKYFRTCLLYTSPSPRDKRQSRMPSSA